MIRITPEETCTISSKPFKLVVTGIVVIQANTHSATNIHPNIQHFNQRSKNVQHTAQLTLLKGDYNGIEGH